MDIRPAVVADLPEIQAIYAHHVLHGTGSFEEAPPSVEEITTRFQAATGDGWSWLVAADATGVIGYGYYAQYKNRSAYRFTAEDSVYVREDVRGQGVGKALVAALIEQATAQGFRQMVAVIGDSANLASIRLHEKLGFARIGVQPAIGFKLGRWVDSVLMTRPLGEGPTTAPAERPLRG